ncbi:MAG: hypothetical protein LBV41_05875 [Cytophagaceae bacterium]|jgi:hypothetical protein|nr:hypothetical protein [Cytophagaceae bacterium]
MNSKLNEQQSLLLISEMIEQARNNFQKGAGNAFILNGCAVAFIALLNVALVFIMSNPNQSYWVWWLMAPVWFIDRLLDKKIDRAAQVKTHIDKIIGMAWRAFSIATVIFLIIIFGYAAAGNNWRICILITPMMMLMAGTVEFITAKACRFKPILAGAYILWSGALCCLATYTFWYKWSGITHFFILAVCMILGFAVPGYKLNKMAKGHV